MSDHVCPGCSKPVTVWADDSGGVTVNFRCDNEACEWGKGPWDTDEPNQATVEERNGKHVVIYAGAVVGRHTAKYKAIEQRDRMNGATNDND